MSVPVDGSVIRFTRGFYTDREYLVVNNGQLYCRGELVFWEFFADGARLGPLGEAKWIEDCEQLHVAWEYIENPDAEQVPWKRA